MTGRKRRFCVGMTRARDQWDPAQLGSLPFLAALPAGQHSRKNIGKGRRRYRQYPLYVRDGGIDIGESTLFKVKLEVGSNMNVKSSVPVT